MGLHGLMKLLGKVAVLSDSQRFKRRYESKRTAWLQPDGEGELRRKSPGKTPEPSAVMEVYMKNTHILASTPQAPLQGPFDVLQ